jgi:Carboxypeptidase regulatory-like domain/TonB dependent receptor
MTSQRHARLSGFLVLLALVLGLQSMAHAQTGAASITGLVTDTSGAAAPGVTVTATNQATNVDYTAVSNSAGNYTITTVPIGTYVVKAALTGFKTTTWKGVGLEAKQIARLDFKLEVGALEDSIEVIGQSPVLQTESATVGEVLSAKTIESLPLNGRNTSQLALLLPGAVTPNPGGQTDTTNRGAGARPYVNGNREQTNNFMVDGVEVNDTMDNRVGYQPSPDALAEISVETNNYAADIGNVAGGVISNVIKSGANQFRGNLFEFYRNSDFDANTWERNRSSAARAERKQHIFGATLGGPIIKDKLFFFVNYQGTILDQPGTQTVAVAPEAWRRGDLSSITAQIRDPLTGQPFPGNQIPLSRISPTALAILNSPDYPVPNRTVTGVTGNYVGDSLSTTRAHQGDLRLDWNASANDKLFLRFSIAELETKTDKQAFPLLLPTRSESPFRNLAVNWSHVFGPSVINEVLVGYNSVLFYSELNDWAGIGDANAQYGIPGGQPIAGLSAIQWGQGLTSIGAVATVEDSLPKIYQLNEKLTWLKGRHALKFGGQWLRYDTQRFYPGNNGLLGLFNYTNTFTGSQFSDFLLDQVSLKGRGFNGDPWTHLQNRISLFVQDDFKIRPDLTLNLGLRWAYTSPLVEADNRQANFNLQTGEQILASDGSIEDRALYKPYKKGFEPRVGFAWSATDRLVLRGGYGISQYMEGTGSNLRLPLNPPYFFESDVRYDQTTGAGTITTGFVGLVPRDQVSGQPRAWDPNLRPQFTQQWNVFAEYQLTSGMSGQVGYVGHHATHLVTPVEGNQPLPGVGDPSTWAPLDTRRPLYAALPLVTNISTTASRGRSNYNALQASVRQRQWNGLELMASYTFGKILTNNLGYYGSAGVAAEGAYWVNAYDEEANYGRAFHDIRHNFVFAANYELPWGKGKKWGSDWSGVADGILGGWKVAAIFQARTGFPITVQNTNRRSLQGTRSAEWPNCIGNPVPSNQSITSDPNAPADSKWLDINAFQTPALGTFGNCGIGIADAPGYTNVDASLSKRFNMGGPRYVEFRAEAFNLLNHPNFGPPGRDIATPNTFGIITSTVGSPRVVEFVLKFFF